MVHDPKKAALLILGAPKDDKQEPEQEPDHDEGLTAAMEEFIDAVHAKDAKAAAKAFRSAFQIADCGPDEEDAHDDEEEEGDESAHY